MRPYAAVLAGLAATLAIAGCGTRSAAGPPPATVTAEASAPASAEAAPSVVEPVPTTPASWPMPNLVGANLQDAQNAIQSLTGFQIAITTSTDATGAGRLQVIDSNWKVCSQNVPAGAEITTGSQIDFGAVKLDENC